MKTVNMHEAKTHLSKLVEAASRGESFVIARAGKPLVKVEALEPAPRPSRLGGLEGKYTVPDDFDTMFADEIAEMFDPKNWSDLDKEVFGVPEASAPEGLKKA